MSQAPNTRSSSEASGTKSWIFGIRRSVRFPKRIVPSWVKEPTGCAIFFFIASTPAMNVVLTAPSPGIRTPSFPDGASILTSFFTTLPPETILTVAAVYDRRQYHALQDCRRSQTAATSDLVLPARGIAALGPT